MNRIITIAGILLALVALSGCDADRMSEKGFGTRHDLPGVRQQAIDVTTKHAIHFFDNIQITQVMAIHDNEIRSPDPGYPVKRKTDGLVYEEKNIQEDEGDNHCVNERR